jgi:G patch domain-containing protein 1
VARPEDYMDEEDLQDLKDSRILVDTADEMDLTAGGQSGVEETEYVDLQSTIIHD